MDVQPPKTTHCWLHCSQRRSNGTWCTRYHALNVPAPTWAKPVGNSAHVWRNTKAPSEDKMRLLFSPVAEAGGLQIEKRGMDKFYGLAVTPCLSNLWLQLESCHLYTLTVLMCENKSWLTHAGEFLKGWANCPRCLSVTPSAQYYKE